MRRLLAFVAFAMAFDVTTTAYSLARGQGEGNAVMAAVLALGGLAAFVVVKSVAFAAVALIALTWPRRAVRYALGVGVGLTLYFGLLNLTGGS